MVFHLASDRHMKRTGVCRNIIKYTRVYRQGLFYVAINIRQTGAIFKRRTSNGHHGVADGHGSQTAATFERRTFNTRHGIRDGDGGQTAAVLERIISNARD